MSTAKAKDKVTADDYHPVFLQDVTTTVTTIHGQIETPVNPVYCLTKESTEELAEILADLSPEVFMSTPQKMMQGGGGVVVSHRVGWLKFPSGLAVNAGTEANYWTNAPNGATAERNCRLDIAAAQRQYDESPEKGEQQAV